MVADITSGERAAARLGAADEEAEGAERTALCGRAQTPDRYTAGAAEGFPSERRAVGTGT